MRNNERLLRFSTNAAHPPMHSPTNPSFNATDPAGLPRRTAETSMNTQTAQLRWVANTSKNTTVVAQYRLYRLDNRERPFVIDQFIREDQDARDPNDIPGPGLYSAVLAQYTKQTASVEGSYSFNPDLKATAGYTFERTDRDFREVARADDNRLKLSLDGRFRGAMEMKTSYEHSKRTTSPYDFDQNFIAQGDPLEHPMVPWFQKFDEAPYSKDETQVMVTVR